MSWTTLSILRKSDKLFHPSKFIKRFVSFGGRNPRDIKGKGVDMVLIMAKESSRTGVPHCKVVGEFSSEEEGIKFLVENSGKFELAGDGHGTYFFLFLFEQGEYVLSGSKYFVDPEMLEGERYMSFPGAEVFTPY